MNLPPGVFERFRQPRLIRINDWAVIRIENDKERYPHNVRYKIKNLSFQAAIAPYLHSDWEEFDRFFYLEDRMEKDRNEDDEGSVLYSKAEHFGEPRFPNIIVVPNIHTRESRGLAGPLTVMGSTMGHYNPISPGGYRIQEVYEFQSFGLLVLDHENGNVEMWVARDGDKVSIPTESHVTLYNLGDKDHPLVCLNLSDAERVPSNKTLISKLGPILLIYYDDTEVTFTLNRFYINSEEHSAGVRIKRELRYTLDRQIKLSLGARLDLGRFLYEQLTQNPDLIGQFARLGIWIKQASSEAFLEPLLPGTNLRLYFSLPLVEISKKGTDVYRYFSHSIERGHPEPPILLPESEAPEAKNTEPLEATAVELNRPLVILVEGVGDWIEQTYHPLFERKVKNENKRLSVFYADDTRWKSQPVWANLGRSGLHSWEVYLDKADPDDFSKYQKLRPDVVFIVTPDFTHSLIAQYWLNKVPTIFVEKPFDSQVTNIEDLRRNSRQPSKTEVLGLDHYQFYALPIEDMKEEIKRHLGGALEDVTFYLTEDRPIEQERMMSLQHGLTLDLLPHLFALLSYFGKVSTIDQIRVIEAGRYIPMDAWPRGDPKRRVNIAEKYLNETYSRVEFTIQDDSGNGYNVPCRATVGKGFAQEVKYLQIKGSSGNAIRIDLKERPSKTTFSDYPWDSLFFLQYQQTSVFQDTIVRDVRDPYSENETLPVLNDVDSRKRARFCLPLVRRRYEKLVDDVLNSTTGAVRSTLTLQQGQSIVRALDRVWWAIQIGKHSWKDYTLQRQNPFELVPEKSERARSQRDLQERIQRATLEKNIRPLARPLTNESLEGDLDERRDSRPVGTRGLLLPAEPQKQQTLRSLLTSARTQTNEMPLTIVIRRWQHSSAIDFLKVLSNLLQKWDAVWLVSSSRSRNRAVIKSLPTGSVDKTVVLDLTKGVDKQIYKNLVADIFFVVYAGSEDAGLIEEFERRCRFVFLAASAEEASGLLRAEDQNLPNVYRWLGKGSDAVVHVNPRVTTALQDSGPLQLSHQPVLADIGSALKELAIQIEKDSETVPTRRGEFRSQITKILDRYPNHVRWDEDLVRIADEFRWPSWAVESLPRLYVPLRSADDNQSRALVWEYIHACIPQGWDYSIKVELCGGRLLEMIMPSNTKKLIESFVKVFDKHLSANPHSSEGSFVAGINVAMQEIKRLLNRRKLATDEKYDAKLAELRDRMLVRR